MPHPDRLLILEHPKRPPRELTARELSGLLRIADSLIPQTGEHGAASQAPDYESWLTRALAARSDAFDQITAAADRLAGLDQPDLDAELRRLSEDEPLIFQPLSAVVAGAYLMVPEVRETIGYPGQERKHPRFDEAAEEIMGGILDPVLERGSIHTPA